MACLTYSIQDGVVINNDVLTCPVLEVDHGKLTNTISWFEHRTIPFVVLVLRSHSKMDLVLECMQQTSNTIFFYHLAHENEMTKLNI